MSSKNKLQEYFQKRQLSLPEYRDWQQSDEGTQNVALCWYSIVTLRDGREMSGMGRSKVAAQQEAAKKALTLLKTELRNNRAETKAAMLEPITLREDTLNLNWPTEQTPTAKEVLIFDEPTALLVDLENLPKIVDELPPTLGLDVYVFVGKHHPLADKEFNRPVIRIVSPSTRRDGTDTCMQVYVGMLLTQCKYEHYIIATMDHYGAALVEMIQSNTLGWTTKSARLVTRSKQL